MYTLRRAVRTNIHKNYFRVRSKGFSSTVKRKVHLSPFLFISPTLAMASARTVRVRVSLYEKHRLIRNLIYSDKSSPAPLEKRSQSFDRSYVSAGGRVSTKGSTGNSRGSRV